MKKIIVFCLLILALSYASVMQQQKICFAESEFYYTDNIEHLFTHCLIAYPEIGFKNKLKNDYNRDCITPSEFKAILKQLHKNNYALVDIRKCFTIQNGKAVKNKMKMPLRKKPLVFSFDDVNYDTKKMGMGMIDKLIIDKNGRIASQTVINNKIEIKYDNEFVPILENFVEENPDFSIDGAKGTLCLTGYDGILGYRTQESNTINRDSEINQAQKVVDKLKGNGWNFACHSYGHYHMKKISFDKFKGEVEKWNNEVVPIIGKTDIYVYPYGEWEILNSNGNISEKHQLLKDNGFNLFCGVGMQTFFSYLPYNNQDKCLFMDRKSVDGYTLKNRTADLKPLFDTNLVYDYTYRNLLNSN